MTSARNRTAEGPFIRSPARPLRVRRQYCHRILMRRQTPGPNHGRWEPISSNGFMVVCASKLEAYECIWFVAPPLFPRPESLLRSGDGEDADFAYMRWLLDHHFVIENHVKGSDPMEMWFSDFIRGWYPDAEDVPGVTKGARSGSLEMLTAALKARWEGR